MKTKDETYSKEGLVQSNIFEAIIHNTHNGVIITDKDAIVQYMNKSAEDIVGLKGQELIGASLYEKVSALKVENLSEVNEHSYLAKFEQGDILIRIFPVPEQEFYIHLMQDVEDTISLFEQLKKSQDLNYDLKEILDGSYDGVLVTDGDGNVLYVNQSYERITAIKRDEIFGKNMRELINPIWMPNSVAFVVMEEKRAISKKQMTKEGKSIIVTGMPIFDKSGKIKKIVINARDITEIYKLREELLKSQEMEKLYLLNSIDLLNTDYNSNDQLVIASSDAMKEVFELARKVSNFNATVLILGESGVGKEEVAKYIHNNSIRKNEPFITINCGAIPDNLLESELFGYERGAFTGALQAGKEGLLELANGGTVLLDEIGEVSLDFQVKLLRTIETKEILRIGGLHTKVADIRILAATNRNLEEMVEKGTFREDLYYRLNVVQIRVPPLRTRVEDIGPMSMLFLAQFNKKYNQNKIMTYDIIKEFDNYLWPGNARQLKNVVENMVVISSNEYFQVDDIPWKSAKGGFLNKTIDLIADCDEINIELAIEILERRILERAKSKYKTTREIADHVGLNQSTVVRKLNKYNII